MISVLIYLFFILTEENTSAFLSFWIQSNGQFAAWKPSRMEPNYIMDNCKFSFQRKPALQEAAGHNSWQKVIL